MGLSVHSSSVVAVGVLFSLLLGAASRRSLHIRDKTDVETQFAASVGSSEATAILQTTVEAVSTAALASAKNREGYHLAVASVISSMDGLAATSSKFRKSVIARMLVGSESERLKASTSTSHHTGTGGGGQRFGDAVQVNSELPSANPMRRIVSVSSAREMEEANPIRKVVGLVQELQKQDASVGAKAPMEQFTITIPKGEEQKGGVILTHFHKVSFLLVDSFREDGYVVMWNKQNKNSRRDLRVGDRIWAVNGLCGTGDELMELLRKEKGTKLILALQRPTVVLSPAAGAAPTPVDVAAGPVASASSRSCDCVRDEEASPQYISVLIVKQEVGGGKAGVTVCKSEKGLFVVKIDNDGYIFKWNEAHTVIEPELQVKVDDRIIMVNSLFGTNEELLKEMKDQSADEEKPALGLALERQPTTKHSASAVSTPTRTENAETAIGKRKCDALETLADVASEASAANFLL